MKKIFITMAIIATLTATSLLIVGFRSANVVESAETVNIDVWSDSDGNIRYTNHSNYSAYVKVTYKAYWNTGDIRNPTWKENGTHSFTNLAHARTRNGTLKSAGMRELFEYQSSQITGVLD